MVFSGMMEDIRRWFMSIRNLYGRFWSNHRGQKEYYLKLDGYFYSEKEKYYIAVIRVRNKRTTDLIPIAEIVNDKEYLKELHPSDSCIIGILANNERNNIIDVKHVGWKNMCRLKDYDCFIKSQPVLKIVQTYTNRIGIEITVLQARFLDKKIEIPTIELSENQALLYALDSHEAITVGYEASEHVLRKAQNSKVNL
ncbi:MAG: hypothetical protein K0R98_1064 [Rickettsiaceae bacterium]|jgi:hypothetical protein|nr:hypothetical protein [Rickettsiaceae bacterium]